MPILITRYEIRPEAFTYLLSALFLQILWRYKMREVGFRALFFLPLLQIFWVNLHIYFFIGVILVGVFLFESLIASFTDRSLALRSRNKQVAVILLLVLLASCVNPAGFYGAMYPLFIMQGYEFPVLENYSAPAILRSSFTFLPLSYFLIILGMLALSWVYVFAKDRARLSYANLLLSVMVITMAWRSIRNFGLFAFFALPLTENLRGPIFNNFDIGGYLTYLLYPQERVFVDNRPEAYPAGFFRNEYFPLLQSEDHWMRRSPELGFNAIVFNHRDRSEAGEQFIVRRVLDPAWAPVFFDRDIIILVKRYGSNHATIEKHELSKEQVLSKSS